MDIVQIGNYATAIAAVLGLITAFVYKPIKNAYQSYLHDRKESQDADKAIMQSLEKLDHKMTSLTLDVQRIEGDRLAQKHRYYMNRGFCSEVEKHDVCTWYSAYTNKGGNHLVSTYVDDIMGLPETAERK